LKQAVAFLATIVGLLLAVKALGANLDWLGRTPRLDRTCVSKPVGNGQAGASTMFCICP
jgi:hypothetical protein